jgi:hypothetical protein
MKKLIILSLVLLLTACAGGLAPKATMTWPAVPDEVKTACPDLAQVDTSTTKLSDALDVVSANYTQYYTCKDRVDNWIDWYNNQQKIYNSVK